MRKEGQGPLFFFIYKNIRIFGGINYSPGYPMKSILSSLLVCFTIVSCTMNENLETGECLAKTNKNQ